MKQGFTPWLLGLGLVAFPIACLILALYLAYHPPLSLEDAKRDETPDLPPPAEVTQLPGFAGISDIAARKRAFFAMLVPMVEWRNHQLTQIREEVDTLQATLDAEEALSADQEKELERLRIHFRVSEDNYPNAADAVRALRQRADIIPMEMVLAQAAAESGWGTSRFAVEANNLFGQWCYRQGCGLVPSGRDAGMSHEVKRFDSVNDAVAAYFRNINTNRAYREVRQIRAEQRADGESPTGLAMVEGLLRYSSRGQPYVEELKTLIRYNDLETVQKTWLAQQGEDDSEEGDKTDD